MTMVVDASIAAKWLIEEPDSPLASKLLPQSLLAPDFIFLECANVLWKAVRRNRVTQVQAETAMARLRAIPLIVPPTADLLRLAAAQQTAAQLTISLSDAAAN